MYFLLYYLKMFWKSWYLCWSWKCRNCKDCIHRKLIRVKPISTLQVIYNNEKKIYEENFDAEGGNVFLPHHCLPGQFDQRADSAEQCVKLLNEDEEPIIRSATTYVIKGGITEDELEAIKKYCINPVDSRETGMDKPDTLVQNFDEPADVAVFDGFIDMAEAHLKELYSSLNLAMTFKDFLRG